MSLLFLRLRQHREGKLKKDSRLTDWAIIIAGWILILVLIFEVLFHDW